MHQLQREGLHVENDLDRFFGPYIGPVVSVRVSPISP
jgi:hypothetical protein